MRWDYVYLFICCFVACNLGSRGIDYRLIFLVMFQSNDKLHVILCHSETYARCLSFTAASNTKDSQCGK